MPSNISRKQVYSLKQQYGTILSAMVQQMQTASQTFTETLKGEWADKKSVEALKQYDQNMKGFLLELNQNVAKFRDMLQAVCDNYTAGDRMDKINIPVYHYLKATFLNFTPLDHFEGGDVQGLANDNTSAQVVVDALSTFKTDLTTIKEDAVTQLKGINAFGDPNLQAAVAESAGKVVGILSSHINKTVTDLDKLVGDVVSAYTTTATSSTTAATMQVSTGN